MNRSVCIGKNGIKQDIGHVGIGHRARVFEPFEHVVRVVPGGVDERNQRRIPVLVPRNHRIQGRIRGFAIAADLGKAMKLDAPVLRLVKERWAYARDQLGASRDNAEAVKSWDEDLEEP